MPIVVRSELPGDEPLIDEINCRAFGLRDEAYIIELMRHTPGFDRRFSLLAWDGEQAVGHTLFSPARIRLMGQTVLALAVGPVSVVPEYQKRGIAGHLLRSGHELGRREGFALAFLYGHPAYYPRHGYRPAFGHCKITVNLERLPAPTTALRRLPVRPADLPWLVERHAVEWANVDFAWLWGPNLCEWTLPGLNALMWWTEDGRRAAYTLTPDRSRLCMLLAEDAELARQVLFTLKPKTLDQHPSGWLAKNVLQPEWAQAEAKPGTAAMAFELQAGVLEPCLEAQRAGRPPGCCMFPTAFLLC